MLKRGAIELSFGWLFAIFAGLVIIFLAIYFSSKIIGTEKQTTNAETAKEIGILLSPLETNFESAQTTSISIPQETRFYNICLDTDIFGKQKIQVDQKNMNSWSSTNISVSFQNKYIFSGEMIQGKKFYLFSKSFYFPFKIADLVYMTSANDIYCFNNAPKEIKEEIENLNQDNLLTENCSEEATINICFGAKDCDINVNMYSETVEKDNEIIYFSGLEDSRALMYAAIFSDKEVYECELRRLMMRLKELLILYENKEIVARRAGCDDDLGSRMDTLASILDSPTTSKDLSLIREYVEQIEDANDARICMLW